MNDNYEPPVLFHRQNPSRISVDVEDGPDEAIHPSSSGWNTSRINMNDPQQLEALDVADPWVVRTILAYSHRICLIVPSG